MYRGAVSVSGMLVQPSCRFTEKERNSTQGGGQEAGGWVFSLKDAKGAILIGEGGSGKGVEWEREEPRGGGR